MDYMEWGIKTLFYTAKTLTPTPHNLDKEEHQYLRFDSEHPHKCRIAVAMGQFLRAFRYCSNPLDQQQQCHLIRRMFQARGYNPEALHVAYKKAQRTYKRQTKTSIPTTGDSQVNQHTSIQSTPTTPAKRTGTKLITKYHTTLDVLHKNLTALHTRATTQAIRVARYTNRTRRLHAIPPTPSPPMLVWKRHKNLRDKLVRAHTPSTQ
jgi:hypothetical protein